LIKVDHILAHIYSPWIERNPIDFQFPILVFSASGTHSNFSLLPSIDKYELISDQVGVEERETVKTFTGVGKLFYAISRVLDIDVPKGDVRKVIQKMSQGDPLRFNFIKYYHGKLLNLDFTDFMKSVKGFVEREKKISYRLSSRFIKDVAASFQEAIIEILSEKLVNLAEIKNAKELHLAGGVSLNAYFREKLKEKIKKKNLSLIIRYPIKKEYSLDNAAMIGALAYFQQKYRIKFVNFNPQLTQ
jgi:N6-L-threonylcarbamoyladenine synthase